MNHKARTLALIAALMLVVLGGCAQPAAPATAIPSPVAAAAATPTAAPSPTAVPATATAIPSPTATPAATPTTAVTPTAAVQPATFPLTVKDDAGRSVTIKALPKKIVSLAPGNTEILYALGLGDQVVGVTDFDDYPPEVKNKPKIGGFATVDAEKVVATGADLVLATSLHTAKEVPALEKLGLTVVVLDPQNVDQVLDRITLVGRITGRDKEALALTSQMSRQIVDITAKAKADPKPPRVFWSLGDGLFTVGPGSFVDDLIKKANGTNIAADAKSPYPDLSMEAILKADPEVIVLTGPQAQDLMNKLLADPAWKQVSAIKNKRFLIIPDENIVVRPGPRIASGLEAVAKGLHPDQLK